MVLTEVRHGTQFRVGTQQEQTQIEHIHAAGNVEEHLEAIVVLGVHKVTVCGILQLVAFLPRGEDNGAQPNGQHDDNLDQIEAHEASFILTQSMVDAQPEHEQGTQEGGLQHGIQHAG